MAIHSNFMDWDDEYRISTPLNVRRVGFRTDTKHERQSPEIYIHVGSDRMWMVAVVALLCTRRYNNILHYIRQEDVSGEADTFYEYRGHGGRSGYHCSHMPFFYWQRCPFRCTRAKGCYSNDF